MHARHFIVIHGVYSNPSVCIAADGWMGKGARTSSSSIIDSCSASGNENGVPAGGQWRRWRGGLINYTQADVNRKHMCQCGCP